MALRELVEFPQGVVAVVEGLVDRPHARFLPETQHDAGVLQRQLVPEVAVVVGHAREQQRRTKQQQSCCAVRPPATHEGDAVEAPFDCSAGIDRPRLVEQVEEMILHATLHVVGPDHNCLVGVQKVKSQNDRLRTSQCWL